MSRVEELIGELRKHGDHWEFGFDRYGWFCRNGSNDEGYPTGADTGSVENSSLIEVIEKALILFKRRDELIQCKWCDHFILPEETNSFITCNHNVCSHCTKEEGVCIWCSYD